MRSKCIGTTSMKIRGYGEKVERLYRTRYIELWRDFIYSFKHKVKEDSQKKVEWLVKKWKPENEKVPDVLRGIAIRIQDNEITEEFTSEPRIYGNVLLNNGERKALSLSPRFGLLQTINVRECVVNVEEAINKLRWNRCCTATDNNSNSGMDSVNMINNSVNINRLKCTSLPYNPQVMMPSALANEEEVRIQQFKSDVLKTVKEMARDTQKWSNLDNEEQKGLASLKDRVKQGEIVCSVTDKSGR